MTGVIRLVAAGAAWALVVFLAVPAVAQGGGQRTVAAPEVAASPRTITEFVERESAVLHDRLTADDADRDWEAIAKDADMLLLRVAMSAQAKQDADAWILAARVALQTRLIAAAHEGDRAPAAAALRKHPELADRLVFIINDSDDRPEAVQVLLSLRARFGDVVGDYPALTAAMCAVRDRKVVDRCNENSKEAPPIELVFEYFTSRRQRLAADLQNGPAELLAFLVDATPDVEEMIWANDRFAGNPQVGSLYDTIEYDRDHFLQRRPKRVTTEGFGLKNIARVGGVCIDQAYYAAMIGKAIGVPAVIVSGQGEHGMHHAWVGYLRRQGAPQWDMTEGRHAEARYLSGWTIDPRSGSRVSEADIGVTETLFRTRERDNRLARAIVEGAALLARAPADPAPIMLAQSRRSGAKPADSGPEAGQGQAAPFVRQRSRSDAERLLRDAYAASPALPELWSVVDAHAAGAGTDAMAWWITSASKVAGRWPEFTFSTTERMLDRVTDHAIAARAWDRVFSIYSSRADLASRARVALAERAQQAGDPESALKSYRDAVMRFAGAGPYILDALKGAKSVLDGRSRPDVFADLVAEAWRRVERPSAGTIAFEQTVWCQVGRMYADALAACGRDREADGVRRQIKSAEPADP